MPVQQKIIYKFNGMALSMPAAVVLALALPDIDAAPVNKPSIPGKVQVKQPDRLPRHASRHILVKLEPGTDVPGYFAYAGKHGLTRRGRVYGSDWYTLSLPARANPRAAAAIARSIPGAVMATSDPIVSIGQIPPQDPIYQDDDDPYNKSCDPIEQSCDPLQLVDQWGMFKVGAEDGWGETTGNSSVVIAVLDSGVDLDPLQPDSDGDGISDGDEVF